MTKFHLHLRGPSGGPIETSFEAAEARLCNLERVYFEPDGSFVCSRESGSTQVFGMLYDASGRLQYCELRGQCSLETWTELIVAITGSDRPEVEVLLLPHGELQNLQRFEELWR